MSKTIVKRKSDNLGRIHIPTKIRQELGFIEGEMLEIETLGKDIIISKIGNYCRICGHEADRKIKNQYVCEICIEEIKSR